MASSRTSKPRFSTILSWRGKGNRPSDLEFELRPHCQKLIVKATPLSGAHLLMTSERIAIRTYYPSDVKELREQGQKLSATKNNDDFDGLSTFFSSFQLAVVFFVLPSTMNDESHDLIMEQLGDIDSYFNRAQRLSAHHQEETERNDLKSKTKNEEASFRKSCVMIFPDTASAIENLVLVANSLSPERKASKNALLQRLEQRFFLPSSPSRNIGTTSDTIDPVAVASHVEGGLREIARIFELPLGEVDILMSELGDLKTIATADDSLLKTIPIDTRTREILHNFFGSAVLGTEHVSPSAQTRESHISLQQESFPQNAGMQHLTGIAAQLFSHSKSSRWSNIGDEPTGASTHHPPQALSHGTPSQLHQLPYMDPNMADESWSESINVGGTFPFFDPEDGEFPCDDNTFAIPQNNPGIPNWPVVFSSTEKTRADGVSRRNHLVEINDHDSHVSSMSYSAPPSYVVGNEIDSYESPANQGCRSRSPLYDNPYFEQGPQQHQSGQPEIVNDCSPLSLPSMFNERLFPTSRHQDGSAGLQIFSSRKTNYASQRRYQQPY